MGVLTASIGVVALMPTETTTAAQILGLADQAMYRAKDQGRNQAVYSQTRAAQLTFALPPFQRLPRDTSEDSCFDQPPYRLPAS